MAEIKAIKSNKIRNTVIREKLETLNYIKERQLGWWGHLQCMEETRLTKRI